MNRFAEYAKTHKVAVITMSVLASALVVALVTFFMTAPRGIGDVKTIDEPTSDSSDVPQKVESNQVSKSGNRTPKDMSKDENKTSKSSKENVTHTKNGKTTVSEDGNTVTSEGNSVTKENTSEDNPAPGASGDNPRKSVDSKESTDKPDKKSEGAGSNKDKSDKGKDKGNKEKTEKPKSDDDCKTTGTAYKVLVVRGTGGANAKVTQCEKKSNGTYKKVKSEGGHVGYGGISGSKVEGDGATPTGVYSLGNGFGVRGKPGSFSKSWTKVTKDYVWVDGKGGPKGYNTMQKKSDGYSGESLYQTPSYNYAQVINYNSSNTPNKGSAIFLHVNTGSGKTAGCVSVSQGYLLDTFAWGATQIDIK